MSMSGGSKEDYQFSALSKARTEPHGRRVHSILDDNITIHE